MDRKVIEAAIRNAQRAAQYLRDPTGNIFGHVTSTDLDILAKAAEAHLATLPKTKVIETWHVTYARLQKEGYWAALVEGSFASRISAEREAARMANDSKNANVSVTGPHQQEVPA